MLALQCLQFGNCFWYWWVPLHIIFSSSTSNIYLWAACNYLLFCHLTICGSLIVYMHTLRINSWLFFIEFVSCCTSALTPSKLHSSVTFTAATLTLHFPISPMTTKHLISVPTISLPDIPWPSNSCVNEVTLAVARRCSCNLYEQYWLDRWCRSRVQQPALIGAEYCT